MKKIKKKDIQYYDEENMNLVGTTSKIFLRIDSANLQKYLELAIDPKTSYVTYIDDFVKENYNPDTHEIPLKYVSVLLKKQRYENMTDTICKEVIGSRIANALGMPTVYNELIEYDKEHYVMSIDFVKTGQEIDSFVLESKKDYSVANYDVWENLFNTATVKIAEYSPNLVENIKKLKKDFVSQFLFRNVILDDGDLVPKNVTLIKDLKTKNLSFAPINDYEFIFAGREERDFEEDVRKYIKYIGEKYPEELKEFTNKIHKTFYKDGVLQEEVLKDLVSMKELEPDIEQEIFEQFRNNVDRFVRLEKEYENSREEICK